MFSFDLTATQVFWIGFAAGALSLLAAAFVGAVVIAMKKRPTTVNNFVEGNKNGSKR